MQQTLMNLKILLPFRIFAEQKAVTRIVAETREGAFGLLPQRLGHDHEHATPNKRSARAASGVDRHLWRDRK